MKHWHAECRGEHGRPSLQWEMCSHHWITLANPVSDLTYIMGQGRWHVYGSRWSLKEPGLGEASSCWPLAILKERMGHLSAAEQPGSA